MQIHTFHKTRRQNRKVTYPYMPEKIPNDGYLYDFHFHSYYSDGRGSFTDILLEISRKNHLHGLTITDHPYHLGKDLSDKYLTEKVLRHSFDFQKLVERFKNNGKISKDFISFPGSCEFFTRLSEDRPDTEIELIVLGVSEDFIKKNGGVKRITNNCFAEELIEKVHDDNGLVILPHPFFFTRAHEFLRFKLSRNSRPDAVEGINYSSGFFYDEAYHGFLKMLPFSNETISISQNFGYFNWIATIITQQNNYGKCFNYPIAREIAAVGSSDAHFHTMIGAACTLMRKKITSIEDLREGFAKRETLPIFNPIWSEKTRSEEVYREIWEAYGDYINDGIKKRSLLKWILAKTFVNITSFLFD